MEAPETPKAARPPNTLPFDYLGELLGRQFVVDAQLTSPKTFPAG
jgi:hypothetical protein